MRWLPDPGSLDPPRVRELRRRRRIVLASLALALIGALGWWAFHPWSEDAGAHQPGPALQSGAEAVGEVTDLVEGPHDEAAPGTEDEATAEAEAEDEELQAQVPTLRSDDTDLSFARRAGLHRAANPLQVTASAVLAMDADTGEILHARNDLQLLPIASLTKLLSAMVVLDAGLPLGDRITIADEDVDRLRYSRSRLRVGTSLTRGDALRLALMSSENRAAHALGRTFPGGVDAFVKRMNAKAQAVGATNAVFEDPTGLSNGNRATARDVAALVAAATKYRVIRDYSTQKRHQARLGQQKLAYVNSNRLVRNDRWPALLQKTGYIVEAGWCLAMNLRVDGRNVILVLLDAGSGKDRDGDARRVRKWLEGRR